MADHTDKALMDLTAQLADAIMSSYGDASAEQLAAALLPVVRRLLDLRAAQAWDQGFEAAYHWWTQRMDEAEGGRRLNPYRAAALRGEAGRET